MLTKNKPKILFFDLETTPLKAWVWSTGKQYIGHKQLVAEHSQYGIICATYCWNDNKPAKAIDWGYEEQSTKDVIKQFDEIIKQADFCIGKNNNRFDNRMINAARMFAGLPGMPEWTKYTDDLEVQMRRYFRMPSQSLDYISSQLGLGGKIKMEMQDWIDIVEQNDNGKKSLAKMIKYGKKDVADTRALWFKLAEHFDSKWNQAKFQGVPHACKHMDCGSLKLNRDGVRYVGKIKYQHWRCADCDRYAGRSTISDVLNKEGGIS